ncbi:MAG: TonB-dependent receptor [Opitutaceae bacterium]
MDPLVAVNEEPIQLPAQVTTEGTLGDEDVSSPKYTRPIADVPQTVEVITPEVYGPQGAVSLSDVLRNTPGITFFAGEGGSANHTGGDSFYLRGFDTSDSIFVDGVRDEGQATHDLFDVEQVEIFKGPSPDNGRGGTAGYVNLESKLPQAEPLAELDYMHGFGAEGSLASDRATLDLNEPLTGGPVAGTAFRLNLMDQEGGVPARQHAENNRWGVAPSLAFGLGKPTRLFLSYEHQYEHNLPDYGLPSTVLAGLVPTGSPGFYSPGADLSGYYGFANFDYEHVTLDAITARIEHDLAAGFTLSNQTRYDRTGRRVESSAPSGSVTLAPKGEAAISQGIYETDNEILSNQTNLAGQFRTGPVEHDLTTGLELSRETADNPTWSLVPLGTPSPSYLLDIYRPDNFPAALFDYDPHQTGAGTWTRIDTEALYAFDTLKPRGWWELDAGLRLEHYAIDETSAVAASPAIPAFPGNPATAAIPATAAVAAGAAVPASDTELGANDTLLTGKAGLVFKPSKNGRLYVSYAESDQPPGTSSSTNALSTKTTSADNPLFAPERAEDYELGAKWQFFDSRLSTAAALFRSMNRDVPAADPVTGHVSQTSDQTVQGVELSVSGKLTRDWLIYAGYSAMEAEVSDEISTNAQGLTLPLLPRESGNLWTTYAWLNKRLTAGAGLQYMGDTERLQATGSPAATTFANGVPSFWLFNAMLSYAFDKHLTLRLNADNLANREYIASLNNNGYRVNLGAPRVIQLTAELRF